MSNLFGLGEDYISPRMWKKVLSVILSVIMALGSSVALVAGTEKIQQFLGINSVLSAYAQSIVDTKGASAVNKEAMSEDNTVIDLEKRDGSDVLYRFSEPISFVDENGVLKTKDINIEKQKDKIFLKRGYTYSNGPNDYRINFSEKSEQGVLTCFKSCSYSISPMGGTSVRGRKGTGEILGEEFEVFEYPEIYGEGTNLRFYPQLNGLKDEIVLNTPNEKNTFDFKLTLKGCMARLNEDSTVSLLSKTSGEEIQTFTSPYAFDSEFTEGDYSEHYSKSEYLLKQLDDDTYILTVKVNKEWLNSSNTVYPVVIDPTTGHIDNTHDTGIYSKNATTCYGKEQTCCFGLSEYGYGRTLMYFPMPSAIKAGAVISSAYMWERETTGRTTTTTVQPYVINNAWSENYTTWETRPTWDTTIAMNKRTISAHSTDDPNNSNWYKFNITPAVKKWVSGAKHNYGLIFISSEETNKNQNWRAFTSKQYSTSSMRPYSVITYTNDTTAPTATVSKTPSDWTNGSVTVQINSAADNSGGAGLHASPYSFSSSSDTYNWGTTASKQYTSNQTVYVSVRDKNNNIKKYTVNIDKIDKIAPAVPNVSGAPNEWTNGDVTLSASSSDSDSGVKEYIYTTSQGEELISSSGEQTFTGYTELTVAAKDNAGNISAESGQITVSIDKQPPVISDISVVKNDDESSAALHISVSAQDELSGVVGYSIDGGEHWQTDSDFDTDISQAQLSVKVKDNAGNIASGETQLDSPEFYRENQLVGVLNPGGGNETMQYRIGEDGEWQNYEVPFAIPFGDPVKVYARFSGSGTQVCKTFSDGREYVSTYTESSSDCELRYKNISFDFSRYYDGISGEWFFSPESSLTVGQNGDIINAVLTDSTKLVFVKTSLGTYKNELNGYILRKITNEDGELTGYTISMEDTCLDYTAQGKLSAVREKHGDVISFERSSGSITVSDPTGREYVLSVNENGKITSITDPAEGVINYTYNNDGKLTDVTDQSGVTLGKYGYSLSGAINRSLDKTISYNPDGTLKEIVYASGAYAKYAYEQGVTEAPDNGETDTGSDEDNENSGEETGEDFGESEEETLSQEAEYVDSTCFTVTVTDSTEHTTSQTFNSALLVISSVDEDGKVVTYTYDNKMRMTGEKKDGSDILYEYDSLGNLISQCENSGENQNDGTQTPQNDVYYNYDSQNRVIRQQTGNEYTYYVYNSNSDIIKTAYLKDTFVGEEKPLEYIEGSDDFFVESYTYEGSLLTASSDEKESTNSLFVYDAYGNCTKTTVTKTVQDSAEISITDCTYDIFGNVLSSQSADEVSSYVYDRAGRVLRATQSGKTTRTIYDNLGRVVQEIGSEDYDSTKDGLPEENTYSDENAGHTYIYDENGTLTSETNRIGQTTTYYYNDRGSKIREDFDIYKFYYLNHGELYKIRVSGTVTVVYNYDNEYKLSSVVYANDDKISYDYNVNGDVIEQCKNDNSRPYVTYTYNGDGDLIQKINTDTGLRYVYNGDSVSVYKTSDDSLVQSYTETRTEEDETSGVQGSVSVSENNFGNVSCVVYSGKTGSFTRGENSAEYSYTVSENDEEESVQTESLKYNSVQALTSSYTYDSAGNITKKSYSYKEGNQSCTIDFVNTYDENGRILSSGFDSQARNTYTYDNKGQLVRSDSGYVVSYPRTYTYDERGNILTKKIYDCDNADTENDEPQQSFVFTYSDSGWTDKLISVNGNTLTYDDVGNVLTYGGRNFTWENGRNLKTVTEQGNICSYTYDEDGIRTSKTVNGVTTYYNTKNGTILSQTDGTDTMEFQYDEGGAPLGFVLNGVQYWYLTNQMGDVAAITDAQGELVASYYYDDWGGIIGVLPAEFATEEQIDAANKNPLRYRGYYFDSETGYYYLQSRYYDPEICRFINADIPEIAQMSKDIPVGTNLFAYCNNDPLNNCDADGNWAEKIAYNYNRYSYDVNVRWAFLSKKYCLLFANDLKKNAYKVTGFGKSRIKGLCFGMTVHRMAVEIWFHAMVYYGGYPLSRICSKFKTQYWDRANPITVNMGDSRAKYFYAAWYAAATVKRILLCSHIPKLVKIGAAIVL